MKETVEKLKIFSKGDRLGLLFQEEDFNHRIHESIMVQLGLTVEKASFAGTFDEWKEAYLRLQEETDMVILFNPVGLAGWDEEEALRFVREMGRVPTGITLETIIPLALLEEAQLWPLDRGERE